MDVQQNASANSVSSSEGEGTLTPATVTSWSGATLAGDLNAAVGGDQVEIVVEMSQAQHASPNSIDSQLQESTLAPSVFRKHLKLMKTEDKALFRLYEEIESRNKPSPSAEPHVDKGSKTNLLHLLSHEDIHTRRILTSIKELDLTRRISIEEVAVHPNITQTGKQLICMNATLPVLSLRRNAGGDGSGSFVISAVIENTETSPKAVRLEIPCGVKTAEDFFHKMKHPYLNNLEPGSLILIQDPVFVESLVVEGEDQDQGTTYCVRGGVDNVEFLAFPPGAAELFAKDKRRRLADTVGLETIQEKSKASMMVSSSCESRLAADEWKKWGNEYSVARLHSQALFAYNAALRFDPDNVELASSRSAALINLGFHSGALQDVDFINAQDPFNTGYILRKVNCLWGLGSYHEAIHYLDALVQRLVAKMSSNTSNLTEDVELKKKMVFVQTVIVKTEKILQQRVDPGSLGNERYFKGSPAKLFNDEPEYFKPISVIESDPSGSGRTATVQTNQKVMAGKLLAITKAFYVTLLDDASKLLVNQNDEFVNNVIQKFAVDRPTPAEFYKGVTSAKTEFKLPMEPTKDQVRAICQKHFYAGVIYADSISPLDGGMNPQFSKTAGGIWTFPANIRHACVGGNAIWYTAGNLLFIRATRDLGQGEEVVMAHIDPTKPYEVRSRFLQERGISCYCPLCQFEKSEPEQIRTRRDGILTEARLLNRLNSGDWSKEFTVHEMKKLEYYMEDLIILRSAYAKLNFPIVEPLYNFGSYLMSMNKFDEAVNYFERAFFVVDNTSEVFNVIHISLHLAYCFIASKRNKDKAKSKKCFATMRNYSMLSFGCLDPVKASFKREFEFLERKGIASAKS